MSEDNVGVVVAEFRRWVCQQTFTVEADYLRVEVLPVPHRPTMLPIGWQGVYSFRLDSTWLKVGKAGPKSNARWLSHHYSPTRAMSTLARSLLVYAHEPTDDPWLRAAEAENLRIRLRDVRDREIGSWIKANTTRHNILIKADLGGTALARLEAIAHAILKPVFEGRSDGS